MKIQRLITAVLTVAAISSWAAPHSEALRATLEAQPACSNFVRFDEKNLYMGFGGYRHAFEEPRRPIPAELRVAPLDGSAPFELATNDAAIDIVTEGSTAYVLTYSSIEEWNLEKRERVAEYSTYAISGPLAYMQHAQAMARYKDRLIIAHGRLGVSIFNMKTKHLANQFRLVPRQWPLESMATGVTVQGTQAYVLMDNFSMVDPEKGKPAFRGFVVINMDSESVVSELDGMDPGATSVISDSKSVIVSFMGQPLWKYPLSDLSHGRLPSATQVWKFPVEGHPTGSAAMDDKYYYTCFSRAPSRSGENGGRFRKVPMALDRRVLMLD